MSKGIHHRRDAGDFSRRLLAPLLASLLAGCTTLGPDFHPLQPPSLEKWNQALYHLAEPGARGEADLHTWWTQFHDPALERLIGSAERQSLDLRQAGLRVLQARALLGVANAGRYPQSKLGSGELFFSHQRD
jgi:outer membrane protein TolC